MSLEHVPSALSPCRCLYGMSLASNKDRHLFHSHGLRVDGCIYVPKIHHSLSVEHCLEEVQGDCRTICAFPIAGANAEELDSIPLEGSLQEHYQQSMNGVVD